LFLQFIAVADVFDALTSKRPYKEAWSLPFSTQIDPKAVHPIAASHRPNE
jgi:HD-GYP domain-containing protein (c-di-GMP phosphodiesterase class II)